MSLKLFVNNKSAWEAYLEMVENRKLDLYKQLARAEDQVHIYRLQGKIQEIDDMKRLRDKVNAD